MQLISSENIYPFNCKRGVKPLNLYKVQPLPKEKRKAKRGLLDADLLIVLSPLEHPHRRSDMKSIFDNKVPPPEATPAPKDVQSVTTELHSALKSIFDNKVPPPEATPAPKDVQSVIPELRSDLSNSSATFEES